MQSVRLTCHFSWGPECDRKTSLAKSDTGSGGDSEAVASAASGQGHCGIVGGWCNGGHEPGAVSGPDIKQVAGNVACIKQKHVIILPCVAVTYACTTILSSESYYPIITIITIASLLHYNYHYL